MVTPVDVTLTCAFVIRSTVIDERPMAQYGSKPSYVVRIILREEGYRSDRRTSRIEGRTLPYFERLRERKNADVAVVTHVSLMAVAGWFGSTCSFR